MNADTEFDRLRGRYDSLFDMCDYRVIDTVEPAKSYANPNTDDKFTDIEFEFIKGSVESRPIQELLQHWAEGGRRTVVDYRYLFRNSSKEYRYGTLYASARV